MNFTQLKKASAVLMLFASCLVNQASASLIEVQPISYVFDQSTDRGVYEYYDVTGNKLIDGLYGGDDWRLDLGNGHADEWVGWARKPSVNIDFTLNSHSIIHSVAIGSVQDRTNDVVLPNIFLFSRNSEQDTWSLLAEQLVPESAVNNGFHYTYNFDGLNITDQFLRVQANWSFDGPWTFIDEVDFYTNNINVPEPSSLAIWVLGLMGVSVRRFKINEA